ncbi:hypothetical protein LY90DRAFT_699713 [Neocallimastix californiae]|uniref:C2H2-type domain-containing protein n=1 Tax=Neocallimastix californiae TaxID=1754190 RepID=A0A1Y2ENL4_9FUNG|nr:hypothetical protein LY90DRAFT_699713 [Neocallimastix californiae]|eukprot:ORY73163.1 hypothetical protein LY90DRAFT_699713 [Neocallimastix californiae]
MSNLQDVKIGPLNNESQSQNFNNISFLQEQGEDEISLLYNEIFQNPVDVQNQGLMNLDEGALNDSFANNDSLVTPIQPVNNALPYKASLLDGVNVDAATASNALINQALLTSKAKGTNLTATSSLLNPNVKAFPSTTPATRNNIKSPIPSPMGQTPFLHPMFSTPSFSYINDGTVSTNGVSSPLFEFTPPSTPPHTHTNGASKLKNMCKAPVDTASIIESSPLLCSDVFAVPPAVNKPLASTISEGNSSSSIAFSPALNLPMKKLALFSPNVEDTTVTDIYHSSYNYLDDPLVNSPLLPVNDESATTSSLLPLYNTGMYDVQSPFLMEKPDEGLTPSVSEASLIYDQISPNVGAASMSGLLDTNKTNDILLKKMAESNPAMLNEVSPLLGLNQELPYLSEQDNATLTQTPFLSEQGMLGSSPFLNERSSLTGKSPFVNELSSLTGKSPFVNEQGPLNSLSSFTNSPFINEQTGLVNSPYVGEQPIITLNESPCLPEQGAVPLRNKITSPLVMDPRYDSVRPMNPAYLLGKKRKMGTMNYPYGPLAKIQRIQNKERNSLDEVASGFIKKNDSCLKPSPLLQEISLEAEPMNALPITFKNSNFLTADVNVNSNVNLGGGSTKAKANTKTSAITNGNIKTNTITNVNVKSNAANENASTNSSNLSLSKINPSNSLNSVIITPNSANPSPTYPSSNINSTTAATTLSDKFKPTIKTESIVKANGNTDILTTNKMSSITTTPAITPSPNSFTPNTATTVGNINTSIAKTAKLTAPNTSTQFKKSPISPILLVPGIQADQNFINEYAAMLLSTKNTPSLVSMAGIKLDTKKAKEKDTKNGKEDVSKSTTKTAKTTKTGKKGKREKKTTTETETKPTVNPGGEVIKMKFDIDTKPMVVNNKFLVPNAISVNGTEEMDYHDIPTITLGNTPNLDMLSPASSSIGMTTPNLNSPLLKPLAFSLNSNLQLVKKRAKKKYPCTYPGCTKSFSRPCHRQSHERSHENSRPFVCPECKRAFCRKHDMIRHQRIHSKERPYQCKICKRKFARGDALVRHRTRPTSSCYQADMALAKKIRQQQHRLLQQQQQLEYEQIQKEKQMEEAAAAAAAAANAKTKANAANDSTNTNTNTNANVNTITDVVMTNATASTSTETSIIPTTTEK